MWGLKNLLICCNILVQNYNVKFILSHEMSQDYLDTFFSARRSRSGYNNNPSAKEFKTSYKKLLVHHVSGSQCGNCLSESMFTRKQIIIPSSIIQDTNDTEQNFLFQNDHDYSPFKIRNIDGDGQMFLPLCVYCDSLKAR